MYGDLLLFTLRFNLRSGAIDQHQLDTEAAQNRNIVQQGIKPCAVNRFTVKGNDKSRAAVRVDVGRSGAEPAGRGGQTVMVCHGCGIVHKLLFIADSAHLPSVV